MLKRFGVMLIFSGFLIISSCGDSKNDPAKDTDLINDEQVADLDGSPDENIEPSDEIVGGFIVKLNGEDETSGNEGYTSVFGKIYDGPTPQGVIWEAGTVSGNCTLYKPRVPFCEEPCGGSAVCVEDDVCQDYPKSMNAGIITVKGIKTSDGETEFTMEPVSNNYQSADTHPYLAFDEGGTITFSAAGDAVKKFTLTSSGIAPLILLNESIPIEDGKPVVLTWEAPSVKDITAIHVKMDISHHGGAKGKIECDTADTGSVEISAELLQELVDLGVAGFPTVVVSRMAIDSYASEVGIITLTIASEVEKAVLIEGLNSCTKDEDCPDGETCQDDLTCG